MALLYRFHCNIKAQKHLLILLAAVCIIVMLLLDKSPDTDSAKMLRTSTTGARQNIQRTPSLLLAVHVEQTNLSELILDNVRRLMPTVRVVIITKDPHIAFNANIRNLESIVLESELSLAGSMAKTKSGTDTKNLNYPMTEITIWSALETLYSETSREGIELCGFLDNSTMLLASAELATIHLLAESTKNAEFDGLIGFSYSCTMSSYHIEQSIETNNLAALKSCSVRSNVATNGLVIFNNKIWDQTKNYIQDRGLKPHVISRASEVASALFDAVDARTSPKILTVNMTSTIVLVNAEDQVQMTDSKNVLWRNKFNYRAHTYESSPKGITTVHLAFRDHDEIDSLNQSSTTFKQSIRLESNSTQSQSKESNFSAISLNNKPKIPMSEDSSSGKIIINNANESATLKNKYSVKSNVGDHESRQDPTIVLFTTLFAPSTPRSTPAAKQKYWLQLNTLLAMAALHEHIGFVVFTESEDIRQMCQPFLMSNGGSMVVSDAFKTNKFGTPILKSMWKWTEEQFPNSVWTGYINGDILFTQELTHTLQVIHDAIKIGFIKPRTLVVGRRYNVDLPLNFGPNNPLFLGHLSSSERTETTTYLPKSLSEVTDIIEKMGHSGKQYRPDAEDFFIVTKGAFRWNVIPPFVIGRVAYDNWLVDHATRDGIDVVDVTRTVHAVHQTGIDGNKAGHAVRPDSNWNKELQIKHGGGFKYGQISDSKFHTVFGRQGHGSTDIIVERSESRAAKLKFKPFKPKVPISD